MCACAHVAIDARVVRFLARLSQSSCHRLVTEKLPGTGVYPAYTLGSPRPHGGRQGGGIGDASARKHESRSMCACGHVALDARMVECFQFLSTDRTELRLAGAVLQQFWMAACCDPPRAGTDSGCAKSSGKTPGVGAYQKARFELYIYIYIYGVDPRRRAGPICQRFGERFLPVAM